MPTEVTSSTATGSTAEAIAGTNAYDSLDTDAFLKLLIAELSNQDPMEPMTNSEIVQQISQIREIASNDKLSDTLDVVLTGQNMASAASMLGKMVWGISDEGEQIAGLVNGVEILDDAPKLHVGDETISLKNIAGILDDSEIPEDFVESGGGTPGAADTEGETGESETEDAA